MKPFSIAALQLDLDYSDNFDLVVEKTYQVAKRYPWVQMIVLSELAAVSYTHLTLPTKRIV